MPNGKTLKRRNPPDGLFFGFIKKRPIPLYSHSFTYHTVLSDGRRYKIEAVYLWPPAFDQSKTGEDCNLANRTKVATTASINRIFNALKQPPNYSTLEGMIEPDLIALQEEFSIPVMDFRITEIRQDQIAASFPEEDVPISE